MSIPMPCVSCKLKAVDGYIKKSVDSQIRVQIRFSKMKTIRYLLIFLLFGQLAWPASAQVLEIKPRDPYFDKFEPHKAPIPAGLILRRGDRLAICGDSITEQKMYSRII